MLSLKEIKYRTHREACNRANKGLAAFTTIYVSQHTYRNTLADRAAIKVCSYDHIGRVWFMGAILKPSASLTDNEIKFV